MADDSSVKMETLKKAYAEIILNTSKEAAARIMVADRRAMCFQKDLIALKEDALRLLVQVKQMADSKTAEAEVKSENQQRKIEVLEAQLSEAEGIIVDLREELRLTQDKLEDVKCSQWRPLKQQSSEDSEDQPLPLEKELIAKTDDERYGTDQYASTENACCTKNPDEMALQYACEDQLRMSAEEKPSTWAAQYPSTEVEKPSTSFQPSMLSQDSVHAFGDVNKPSKERCSSSSSEPDEQDAKLVANGSQAKSHEYESLHQGQSFRDGSRRNRKNLKYQEAIAALRRSSHGKNAKSCQLPSLSKCRTKAVKQTKAQGDNAEKESLAECNLHDIQQISEDEESAGICNRGDSDKSLKFTFQRKRKREILEKEDAVKLHKSIVKDEQSKDGRQLLQIAHQLISLSGNGHS